MEQDEEVEEDGGDAGEGGAGFSATSLMTVAQTSIPCVPLSTRSPELLKKGLLTHVVSAEVEWYACI